MLVFKPEIKYITQQIDRMSFMLNASSHLTITLFPIKTCLKIRNAKVKVRGKEDFLSV